MSSLPILDRDKKRRSIKGTIRLYTIYHFNVKWSKITIDKFENDPLKMTLVFLNIVYIGLLTQLLS